MNQTEKKDLDIVTFFDCPDNRATAVYYLNSLNHLSNLKILTKEPQEEYNMDIQLMIEYPDCYNKVDSFFKKRLGTKKVFYSIDPYLTFNTVKGYYNKYDLDHVFTSQKSYVAKFKEAGVDKVSWLPFAAHQMHMNTAIRPSETKQVYDVAFVGTLFNNKFQKARYDLLVSLYKNFNVNPLHLAVPEEIGLLYRTAKIGFNKSADKELNMRTFEIMASGRMLISDPQDGMCDLFIKPDKDYVSIYETFDLYNDAADLTKKVRYYLKDESEREIIAKKAQELIAKKHLYIHRAKELLKKLE